MHLLTKTFCGALIIGLILLSCKKRIDCDYETQCVETEPNGYMVGTMASDVNTVPKNQIATLYQTLHNALAPIGNNWNDASAGANRVQSVFPKYWVSDSIGQIFGIALDHAGGIYFSATDVYKLDGDRAFLYNAGVSSSSGAGPAGAAGIYYTKNSSINTTTPLVKTQNIASANTTGFALIPSTGFAASSGNSLGNIAYDYKNDQLFATNLEDGRIYRIDPATGKVKSILDPFALDNAVAGIAPEGEQLWGIGVYTSGGTTKVYFARTTLPYVNGLAPGGVEIWAVNLTAGGEFSATPNVSAGLFTAPIASGFINKEISIPQGTQNKITDIAFSRAGRMLVAERGNPHAAGVFEYVNPTGASGGWVAGNNFYVGADLSGATGSPAPYYLSGRNSAGGVDYSEREMPGQTPGYTCSDIAWASGNYMPTQLLTGGYPNFVYGAQGMSSAGNSSTVVNNRKTDLYIDYNCARVPVPGGSVSGAVKNKIGDIEFFDQTCPCK